ncbi:MAG TPA: DciA family protein [Pirellulales bacterium]|nr:DciA family protein [Pirellulales bacterium]
MSKGRPKPIGDIMAQLMARRGYAREQSAAAYGEAWQAAAGAAIGRCTRAGAIRRGALEVLVANSTVMQELTFQKSALLAKLQQLLPDEKLASLRFRVGPIEVE